MAIDYSYGWYSYDPPGIRFMVAAYRFLTAKS